MSDNIVRTSVVDEENNLIKKQVMNRYDDHLIRRQVLGIGGEPAPQPTYDTLNATANGTYYPGEGVDAFDEVVVEVPAVLPERELLFDLTAVGGVSDKVKDLPLRTNKIMVSDGKFYGADGQAYLRSDFCFNPAEKYEIVIKCADYSQWQASELSDLAILISFGANTNSHIGIRAHKDTGYWYFSNGSQSSNDIQITDDFYYFSNTERTIKVEPQELPYLQQVLKLNNVNSGGDMMYSNGYLQVYSSAYNWVAYQIPIEYIKIYKIND